MNGSDQILLAARTPLPAIVLALAFDRRGRLASAVLGRSRGGAPEGELLGFALDRLTVEAGVRAVGRDELFAALGSLAASGGALIVHGLAGVEGELLDRLPIERRGHWGSAPRVDLRAAAELALRSGVAIRGVRLVDLALDLGLPSPGPRDPLAIWRISAGAWDLLIAPALRSIAAAPTTPPPPPRRTHAADELVVPAAWRETLERETARVAERLLRSGFPRPTLLIGESRIAPWPGGGDPLTELIEVRLELDAPLRLADWTLLGWIGRGGASDTLAEVRLRQAPMSRAAAARVAGVSHQRDPDRCEGCGRTHTGGRAWLLVSEAGQVLAVARDCLAEICGADPAPLELALAELAGIFPDPGGIPDGWPLPEPLLAVRPTIERAARIVVRDGWHDREHEQSTSRAVTAWNRAELEGDLRLRGRFESAYPPTAEADELLLLTAAEIERIGDREPAQQSDFERRLLAIIRSGYHRPRESGMAAASVLGGLRARDRLDTRGEGESSALFLGELGERLEGMTVRLLEAKQINGDWGPRLRLRARLASGEQIAWWGELDPRLQPGVLLLIDGTVKSHEYDRADAAPRTELLRVEIERVSRPLDTE